MNIAILETGVSTESEVGTSDITNFKRQTKGTKIPSVY